jgi:hypothetical protein
MPLSKIFGHILAIMYSGVASLSICFSIKVYVNHTLGNLVHVANSYIGKKMMMLREYSRKKFKFITYTLIEKQLLRLATPLYMIAKMWPKIFESGIK